MNNYADLSTNRLKDLYKMILKNIEEGTLSKNMYYELGLMILAAKRRGINLDKPSDFSQIVDEQIFDEFVGSAYKSNEMNTNMLLT